MKKLLMLFVLLLIPLALYASIDDYEWSVHTYVMKSIRVNSEGTFYDQHDEYALYFGDKYSRSRDDAIYKEGHFV